MSLSPGQLPKWKPSGPASNWEKDERLRGALALLQKELCPCPSLNAVPNPKPAMGRESGFEPSSTGESVALKNCEDAPVGGVDQS